jgi:hypothetical protein
MPAPPCAYARRVPIPKVDRDRPPTRLKRMLTPFALSKPGVPVLRMTLAA